MKKIKYLFLIFVFIFLVLLSLGSNCFAWDDDVYYTDLTTDDYISMYNKALTYMSEQGYNGYGNDYVIAHSDTLGWNTIWFIISISPNSEFFYGGDPAGGGDNLYYNYCCRLGFDNRSVIDYYFDNTGSDYNNVRAETLFTSVDIYEDYYGVRTNLKYSQNPLIDTTPTFYAYYQTLYPETLPLYRSEEIWSRSFSSEYYDTYTAYVQTKDGLFEMNKSYDAGDESTFVFWYEVFKNDDYFCVLTEGGTTLYSDTISVTSLGFNIIVYPDTDVDEPVLAYTDDFPDDDLSSENGYTWSVYYRNVNDFVTEEIGEHIFTFKKVEKWTELAKDGFYKIEWVYRNNRYWVRIMENGSYVFKFVKTYFISGEIEEYFVDVNVNNIYKSSNGFYDYFEKPLITLDFDEESQSYILRTQDIYGDKALELYCLTITDSENNNYDSWEKFEIGFVENNFLHTTDCYFYYKIPVISAEDKDYRIIFKDFLTDKFSEETLYEFRVDKASEYIQNNLGYKSDFSFRFNSLINWFKDRLGFLYFPIEFASNLYHKVNNINFLEPIISIPELKDPVFNITIYEGIDYNLNDLLENPTINYIHNLQVFAFNFILIFSLVGYCLFVLTNFLGIHFFKR